MSWPLVHIGEHVERVETWNPISSGIDDLFKYIDLSSVDKDSKSITESAVNLIHPNSAPSRARQIVKENDVLISTVRPNLNGVALVNQELDGATASTGYCVLRANKKSLDSKYLFYWVQSSDFVDGMIKNATGANYPAVSDRIVKNNLIPFPPLEEQKRIAAILDKADAIRRKRQQAVKLADDFLRSVFLEMFGDPVTNPKGWERCKFEDLTDMVTYGLTVRPEYIDDGIPLISAKEIRSGTINLEICSRISEADLDTLSSKARPNYGDILFSKTGSIGHCALVDTVEPFAITQNAARVVPNSKRCDSHFLLGLLRTKYFYNLANKEAKGNAVKDLQLGVMKSFPIYAPPLELQKKYSEIFQKFTGQSLLQEAALKKAEESFNSLNQKAFLGEL